MIEKIFRTAYTILVAPLFFLTFLPAYISYVMVFNFSSRHNAIRHAQVVSRYWAKLAYICLLIRVKITGRELIDKKKVYVFVSNHRSLLDVPAWAMSAYNPSKFLSKEELVKAPVFGYVLKRLYLTVNRKDKADRARSIQRMRAALEEGISVYLAPEGTRNKNQDVDLQPFHDGDFRLAIEAQVPVAVFTLFNTDNLLSPKTLLGLRPGTIYGSWIEPIETTGLTEKDIPALREKVWQLMLKEFQQLKARYN